MENEFVATLNANEELQRFEEKQGSSINYDDEPMLRALLRAIMASDIYKEYMEFPVTDYRADCEFWRNIYKSVIFTNPDFLEALEDKSVFWNDDLDTIGTFVLKTVKRFADGDGAAAILPMFKDEEDARFGLELFEAVVKNKDIYRSYIDDALNTNIWESERMAYMDVVIMLTALAEILNFPKIPLTVSVNEYIEIAKAYSTNKSGQFVHGVLADVIENLRSSGKLPNK